MMHRLMISGVGVAAALLAGCWGDGSSITSPASASSSTSSSSSSGSSSSSEAAPVISGSPAASVVAGQRYSFQPSAQSSGSGALTFNIQNTPSWATFNASTGELSGTPTPGDVGSYSNIRISVSDGTDESSLPVFAINVTEMADGSAPLSWTPPTENTDGTALTNLAGYVINYGTASTSLNQQVKIASAGITSYVVSNLSPGTWYFTVTAYSASNTESAPSGAVSYTVD
jgi:Putative Ig domain